MGKDRSQKGGSGKRIGIIVLLVLLIGGGIFGYMFYAKYFTPNVTNAQKYLYIRTGSSFNDVYKTVREQQIVKDSISFYKAAQGMNYINRVKPGRYRLAEDMTNRRLINMLASGTQDPVDLSFHNLRLKEQFAGFIGKQLEPDSSAIINLLDSTAFVSQYGFSTENVYTMFIPNTYQVYWNTTPEKFLKKMNAAYEQFWTGDRRAKAEAMKMDPIKVTILASIVDAEALHDDEMPAIAGLYVNRLNKRIKLESDPTIIFALHDFNIHRVLLRDLSVNSPYNTYTHAGLPPGPIMMPSVNAIDAVLNYQHNNFLFMCAKEDFSGYHNFATNEADHKINARKYQEALNQRNIRR